MTAGERGRALVERILRGRDRPYGRPPAQTPACSFSAPGSSVVLASAVQGVSVQAITLRRLISVMRGFTIWTSSSS